MPKRTLRPLFVIADARIHQDCRVARLHQIALNAQDHLTARIDMPGRQPTPMRRHHFGREGRKELRGVEERPLLLNDAVNLDIAE